MHAFAALLNHAAVPGSKLPIGKRSMKSSFCTHASSHDAYLRLPETSKGPVLVSSDSNGSGGGYRRCSAFDSYARTVLGAGLQGE
jgi:hypothetical protein